MSWPPKPDLGAGDGCRSLAESIEHTHAELTNDPQMVCVTRGRRVRITTVQNAIFSPEYVGTFTKTIPLAEFRDCVYSTYEKLRA